MKTVELARRMAELGQTEQALRAYQLVINEDSEPAELLEAAAYTLDNGGNYKTSYTVFLQLYQAGHFRPEILPLMTKVFYEPNIRTLKGRYERNVKLLSRYPYLFRKDFPTFEDLPLSFFPFDDHHGYVPFDLTTGLFRDFVNVKEPVISRNFFKDLEKPILAQDVFSQYELEYLRDNVRRSEDVARENHVYLHYTDWEEFCAWLQVLSMKPLLEEKKLVFLIGDELSRYPIDFQAEFGIDYSQYPVKPVGVREVTKLIWHTQFSTDNGGDFFNEVFDSHPNLLLRFSYMFFSVQDMIKTNREVMDSCKSLQMALDAFSSAWNTRVIEEMYRLRDRTEKDYLVAWYLGQEESSKFLDPNARIAPALWFQPHFYNIAYSLEAFDERHVALDSDVVTQLHSAKLFRDFKYVKTFSPMRRFTTSYAAAVRSMTGFSRAQAQNEPDAEQKLVVPDALSDRGCNRSFMANPGDRLFRDSVIVRFEDGKLNPKATFTRLAAFLDIPYTEELTFCSTGGVHDVAGYVGSAVGFDPVTVYRTYDEWANDTERAFLEKIPASTVLVSVV